MNNEAIRPVWVSLAVTSTYRDLNERTLREAVKGWPAAGVPHWPWARALRFRVTDLDNFLTSNPVAPREV